MTSNESGGPTVLVVDDPASEGPLRGAVKAGYLIPAPDVVDP